MKKKQKISIVLNNYRLTGKAIGNIKGGTATDDLWKWRKPKK